MEQRKKSSLGTGSLTLGGGALRVKKVEAENQTSNNNDWKQQFKNIPEIPKFPNGPTTTTASVVGIKPEEKDKKDGKVINAIEKDVISKSSTYGKEEGETLPKQEVNGKLYSVLKPIGSGGTSKVFLGMSSNNELVALKIAKDPHQIKGEAALLKTLKARGCGPYVIGHIDDDVDKGVLVLELAETDLTNYITEFKNAPLPRSLVRCWFEAMVSAVQAIHECRVVHSDLKPANFLLVKGRLKLADFGIANKIHDDTVNISRDTQTGTLNYISPEALTMVHPEDNTPRYKLSCKADVWSLGCILYLLVYGKPPFYDFPMYVKVQKILDPNFQIPFPPLNPPDASLENCMRRCLERDVEKRISTPELKKHLFLNPPPPQELLLPVIQAMAKQSYAISKTIHSERASQDFAKNVFKNLGSMHPENAVAKAVQAIQSIDKENFPQPNE